MHWSSNQNNQQFVTIDRIYSDFVDYGCKSNAAQDVLLACVVSLAYSNAVARLLDQRLILQFDCSQLKLRFLANRLIISVLFFFFYRERERPTERDEINYNERN